MKSARVYPELNRRGFALILPIFIVLALAIVIFIYLRQSGWLALYFWSHRSPDLILTSPEPSPQKSPSDETANWKMYTNTKYNYNLKYPNEWSTKEVGSTVVLTPPKETNPTIAIIVNIINYKLTPPLPVNYTYQTERKVVTSYGNILVQIRRPSSEQYIAQITSGDLTALFTFGRGLDRKYDLVFDQILSTFKFTEQNSSIKTLGSFIDSKGAKKFVISTSDINNGLNNTYIYFSNSESIEGNIVTTLDVGVSGDMFNSPYISQNSGTKYLIFWTQNADSQSFYLLDENAKEIKIDFSKMGLGTTIPGMYGLKFGQWIANSTDFTIVANSANGHSYQATFDATTGKQIGETKQIS